jgi:DNA-binding transcriptional LysR family regulator
MVSAGLGVAVLPRLAVEFNDPSCAVLPLGDLVPPRRLVLLWHADRYRSPAAHAFTEKAVHVCEAFADDERTAA